VVGLDNGGTCNNATVLDATGQFLVDHLVENPSLVHEGPESAVEQLAEAFTGILTLTSTPLTLVRAVGLDTPGPASADGVISSKGSTNFNQVSWHGFDIRGALEARIGLPVIYHNDANAAALYAHHQHFGADAGNRSSVAAIVGTGMGGGVVEAGRVVSGAAGMAGELGHVQIPLLGVLEDGQPVPECNCGFAGDVDRQAVHHRGQLQRPVGVLPGRRRGGGRAEVPAVVPQHGPRTHPAAAGAGRRGDLRAGARSGHGRCARRRGGRPGHRGVHIGDRSATSSALDIDRHLQ
jgi:hypothetical protein